MEKQKLLILGHRGFIGSSLYLYEQLQNKYEIYTADTYFNSFIDLKNQELVEMLFNEIKPDIVIHAAAVTTGSKDVIERPYLHVTDNVIMNSIVLEACYRHKVKHTIFLSCTVMYQPKDKPQSELEWNIGDEIYPAYFGVGNMKIFTEKLCEFYSKLPNAGKFTTIRHSNVYGPRDKFDLDKCHMLPAMVKKVCDAEKEIEVWGTGVAKRDLLYIDDLLDFIYKCLDKQENQYELFNCGAGKAYSINEILWALFDLTDKSLEIKYNISKPDIPTTVILNCEKAKKLLGWTPQTPLSTGLEKTIKYYTQWSNT